MEFELNKLSKLTKILNQAAGKIETAAKEPSPKFESMPKAEDIISHLQDITSVDHEIHISQAKSEEIEKVNHAITGFMAAVNRAKTIPLLARFVEQYASEDIDANLNRVKNKLEEKAKKAEKPERKEI